MNTLIVPCAGKSTRFPNLRPKWMLYYPDGKMMVEKAIEGINLDEFDQVIFTIVKEHAEKYEAASILDEIFHFELDNKYRLCVLDDFTSCQSETVYLTLEKCNVKDSFSVKDSDNFIEIITDRASDYIAGINISTFPKEIGRLSGKSFLILNEQGIVTDIIEKQIRSEYICVGMYGFSNAELFKMAYLHLKDISDSKYEIYLSHIISYLVGTKKSVYKYIEVPDYEDWGTITDWNNVLEERKTMIVNIDGILFERMEPYGSRSWKKELKGINKNIEKLKDQLANGIQLILISSIPETLRYEVATVLEDNNISYYQLILGCYLSHELLIGSRDRTIPYPGCDAINMQQGDYLGDYI